MNFLNRDVFYAYSKRLHYPYKNDFGSAYFCECGVYDLVKSSDWSKILLLLWPDTLTIMHFIIILLITGCIVSLWITSQKYEKCLFVLKKYEKCLSYENIYQNSSLNISDEHSKATKDSISSSPNIGVKKMD